MAATGNAPPDTPRKPRRHRVIPVRICGECDAADDVFHLTMVGRRWLCRDCYRALRFVDATPQSAVRAERRAIAAGAGECDDPNHVVNRLRRFDAFLRWGRVGAKALMYLVIAVVALGDNPMASALLFGVFIGDSVGWVIQAWSDARFHGKAVTVEAVLYTAVFLFLWHTGSFGLPAEFGARYLAGGSAALTVGLKGAMFWHKLHVTPL